MLGTPHHNDGRKIKVPIAVGLQNHDRQHLGQMFRKNAKPPILVCNVIQQLGSIDTVFPRFNLWRRLDLLRVWITAQLLYLSAKSAKSASEQVGFSLYAPIKLDGR